MPEIPEATVPFLVVLGVKIPISTVVFDGFAVVSPCSGAEPVVFGYSTEHAYSNMHKALLLMSADTIEGAPAC